MMVSFSSVAIFLLIAQGAQSGAIDPRQAIAPFDCAEIRVDSPNTTYSGFLAADLDTERRFVVTKTANQKRLLTRFENNTLFTLVSRSSHVYLTLPHSYYIEQ
jgi:hypothetical protein